MKLLPNSRPGGAALAVGLAASLLALYLFVFEYRPLEPHYRLRPASWWAGEARLWGPSFCAAPGPHGPPRAHGLAGVLPVLWGRDRSASGDWLDRLRDE